MQCPGTENSRKPEGAAHHKGGGHIKFQDEEYPDLGTTNKKSGKMTIQMSISKQCVADRATHSR
jgi:hypothetical protein